MSTHTRQCPFDGCGQRIDSSQFCCPAHWRHLTTRLKSKVWAAYSAWQKGELTGDELRERQRAVLDEAQGKTV